MAAPGKPKELHHAAPRCLIYLHEKANGTSLDREGIQAWVEWEMEAMRWRVPVEISRNDLEALVEARYLGRGSRNRLKSPPNGF